MKHWLITYTPRGYPHSICFWQKASDIEAIVRQHFEAWMVIRVEVLTRNADLILLKVDTDREGIYVDCHPCESEAEVTRKMMEAMLAVRKPSVFFSVDTHDVEVIAMNNEVYLKDKHTGSKKVIGFFDNDRNYVKGSPNKLDPERHKLKKWNAWAVNVIVLGEMTDDKLVILHTLDGDLCLTVEEVKACPRIRFMDSEEQYSVPTEKWRKYEKPSDL